MQIIKVIGTAIVAILLVIIVWMNITPGYFQVQRNTCNYTVIYIQDKNNLPNLDVTSTLCGMRKINVNKIPNGIKSLLSNLDFNR